ncbi:MAG TPA: hypothetical protein VGI04_07010 [Neobacillus sp.]|jgi:beta-lactamase superfamily II metal-dependent hydrolase
MRKLLLLAAILLHISTTAMAAPSILVSGEKIDLNLKSHEMAVSFLGLSAGEATLIQGPNDVNILIIAGGIEMNAELEGLLSLYHVKEITHLILTNGRDLKYDQLKQLISVYHVKELSTLPTTLAELTKNLDLSQEIVIKSWDEGTKSVLLPELTADVQFAGNEKDEGLDFTLQFFNSRLLLMTSFSQRAEQRLLTKNLKNITIFKVPNGAKEALISEKLMKYINPQISILLAADKQQPDPDIVDDLYKTWSEIYLVKKHDAVTIKFTESNYELFTVPVDGGK